MKIVLMFLAIVIIGATAGVAAGWMFAQYGTAFSWGLLVAILVSVLVSDAVCKP